jgi:hypothetical protein
MRIPVNVLQLIQFY